MTAVLEVTATGSSTLMTRGRFLQLSQRRDHIQPHGPERREHAAEEAHGEGHRQGDADDQRPKRKAIVTEAKLLKSLVS